jgi:hypothetical protein
MILDFLTVLFFVAGLLLFYRMVRPRRRDVLTGSIVDALTGHGFSLQSLSRKWLPTSLMTGHWGATSASFDHLADAARPRQTSDQNPILRNFVPTRIPLLQRASDARIVSSSDGFS